MKVPKNKKPKLPPKSVSLRTLQGHDLPDFSGQLPESWACVDCPANTAPGVPTRIEAEQMARDEIARHGGYDLIRIGRKVAEAMTDKCEIYLVDEQVWEKAGMKPMGGCLCIDCLEKRIGRRLNRTDFPDHELNTTPGTALLLSRRTARPF
jgi:hypothetical protein